MQTAHALALRELAVQRWSTGQAIATPHSAWADAHTDDWSQSAAHPRYGLIATRCCALTGSERRRKSRDPSSVRGMRAGAGVATWHGPSPSMCRARLAAAQSSCALRLERVMYVEVSGKRPVTRRDKSFALPRLAAWARRATRYRRATGRFPEGGRQRHGVRAGGGQRISSQRA
ncbi:Hypothetical protein XFF4834R_chr03570 [Xanthomonas citri pv. fuscans]|nr:Hypothetical protein XFF4834R_chr03570 [Xanthomonas citri pv. fuscans]